MVNSQKMVRLFVGAQISLPAIKSVAAAAETLRRAAYEEGYRVRWAAPASYHVTLKFLGATPEVAIGAIRDRLAPAFASVQPFEFSVARIGAFPSPDNARVIWAGIDDPSKGLARMVAILEAELAELGFARESRPFHPHVTLGRVTRVDNVQKLLAPLSERMFRITHINRATLFESIMKSNGSEYRERESFSLGSTPRSEKRQTGALKRSPADAQDSDANSGIAGPEAGVTGQPETTNLLSADAELQPGSSAEDDNP